MEPWQSWAVALIGAAAVYWYYVQNGKPSANRTRSASVSDFVPPLPKAARRRDPTRAKSKAEATKATGAALPQLSVQSGEESSNKASDASKKRKAGKKQSTTPAPSLTPAPPAKRQELDDAADEEDNKAWARQLASLKKGTSLAPPSRNDSRSKTVKQSAATFSSTSSNAADDDLTPSMSPSSPAGDVSDMLEPTATGPSVLRLTGSSKPTKANAARQQQTQAQEQETKKQRQNRKKIEDRKVEREAEERERQALLETQRRTAREARGEPAKNGMSASKPPTNSAWAAEVANRVTAAPAVAVTGDTPLFDTFEQPNEEDQLRLAKQISQDDSGWNTVAKGKKQQQQQQKKQSAVAGSEDSNTSDAGSVHNAPMQTAKVAAPAPKSVAASTNGYSSLYDSGYDAGSHPDDSQWAA
jgi:hypothetical protein